MSAPVVTSFPLWLGPSSHDFHSLNKENLGKAGEDGPQSSRGGKEERQTEYRTLKKKTFSRKRPNVALEKRWGFSPFNFVPNFNMHSRVSLEFNPLPHTPGPSFSPLLCKHLIKISHTQSLIVKTSPNTPKGHWIKAAGEG